MHIKDDILTFEKYKKAKRSIKCGKSTGEDCIMPEVLTYVPIDDIVLDIIISYQNGFRQKRSTVGHVLAIRRILEGIKNLPCVLSFIDFKKELYSIHRGNMAYLLRSYGIPDKLVNAIHENYYNTISKLYSPDSVSEEFDIIAGVLQGDNLSPYLFTNVLDYALRKAINGRDLEELGFTFVQSKS